MTDQLFVFFAQGIAQQSTGFRPGARHGLMIYITAGDLEEAGEKAVAAAAGKGWLDVEVKRAKEMSNDTALIADDTLRSSAEHALQGGSAIVVYQDEIPKDG